LHPPQAGPLEIALGAQRGGIEGRDRAIGNPLDHHSPRRHEATPGLERLGSGKDAVARDQELVKATALGAGEHRAERVEMTVDVGDT
jgi:hypothetical protein